MKILALEFSSAQRSVAVVDAGKPGAPLAVSEVVETGVRATRAFGLIDDALRAAHLEREQVECVALGLGPGSYTGIRAAISVAQGWELGSAGKTKLLGISSADCLAAQAHAAGMLGRVVVVVDAQRKEFYLADYELSAEGWREVVPLRLAPFPQPRSPFDEIVRTVRRGGISTDVASALMLEARVAAMLRPFAGLLTQSDSTLMMPPIETR